MRNDWLNLLATMLMCACSGDKLELGVKEQTGGTSSETGGTSSETGGSAGRGSSPAGGSGGETTAGGSSSNGAGGAGGTTGFVPPSNWDALTLTESGGFTAPPGEGSDCSLSEYESSYTVRSAPGLFTFDICDGVGQRQMVRRGGFTLTAEELAQVQSAVSELERGPANNCGPDQPTVLLDITAPLEDYPLAVSCAPNPNERTFVSNSEPLSTLLHGWAFSVARPDANVITLTSSDGYPPPPPTKPNFACDSRTYVSRYIADLDAGTFEWDLCPNYTLNQGVRAIDAAEVETVSDVYHALRISSRSVCGADKPTLRAHIDTDEGPQDYADDFYSCRPLAGGGKFVSNMDTLYAALNGLVPQ